MDLIRCWGSPEDLQRELDRFVQHVGHSKRPMVVFGVGAWTPAIDVYETEKQVIVVVDLAGVSENEVELTVKDDVLAIRGVRKNKQPGQRQTYHIMEIQHGPFERVVRLPYRVETENAQATCHEGFLEIVFDKASEPVSKTVRVQLP